MSCPAVEHGKFVKHSNEQRLAVLVDEIKAAGVIEQFREYLDIIHKPDAAFTARLAKKRAERNSFHG